MSEKPESRPEAGATAAPGTEGDAPEPDDDPPADGAPGVEMDDGGEETSPERVEELEAEAELSEELDRLQTEFETLNDRHLRLAAEFENYRKRARSEMTEAWARAQADLVRRLLDSLDDLERVSAQDPEAATVESVIEGVDLVEKKLRRALEEAGVEALEPEGEPFDPGTMEAMLSVPADDPDQDETVARVLQKGYLFKDHLVRPARVSVYKDE